MFSHVRSVMADVIENTLLVDDVPLEFVQTVTEPCKVSKNMV